MIAALSTRKESMGASVMPATFDWNGKNVASKRTLRIT